MTPWTELTRDERILTVLAIGAATICILHFGIFEAPRLWRAFHDDLRALRARLMKRPPSRPQWTEQEEDTYYRKSLDAAAQTGSPWPPPKTTPSNNHRFTKGVH
jgi:hypothetical protein